MAFDKRFLENEVRLGFYIPSEIKQAWAAELEVLQAVDEVCTKYGIRYFADWGTLLGAVRHGGFIPWDDDLDIVMIRQDYDRFLEVAGEALPAGYSVHTFRNEEGFDQFHAVVQNGEHPQFTPEHLRTFHGFPYLCGLDIFLLDYVYPDEDKEKDRVERIKYILAIADGMRDGTLNPGTVMAGIEKLTADNSRHTKAHEIKTYIYKAGSAWVTDDESRHSLWVLMYELAEQICAEVGPEESDELTQIIPWGIKLLKDHRYSAKEYEQVIRLPFEYTTIPVPATYDNLLRRRYGNYMQMIKNAGAHDYPFYAKQKADLQALLDFELPGYRWNEAERQIAAGEDRLIRKLGEQNPDSEQDSDITYTWREITEQYKEAISQIYAEIIERIGELSEKTHGSITNVNISAQDISVLLDNLAECQQLVLDLGNVIESIRGSEHKCVTTAGRLCESLYAVYQTIDGMQKTAISAGSEGAVPESTGSKAAVPESTESEAAVPESAESEASVPESTGSEAVVSEATESVEIDSEFKAAYEGFMKSLDEDLLSRHFIVFMPDRVSAWKNMEPHWRRAVSDAENDVCVIPIPYYYKDYDGILLEQVYDLEEYPEEVPVYPCEGISIEALHPDEIYFSNPFDEYDAACSVSPAYYSDKLRKASEKLTYIPGFETDDFEKDEFRSWRNMSDYVTVPGVVRADRGIVPTDKQRNLYIEKLCEWAGEDTRDIWENKICAQEKDNSLDEQLIDVATADKDTVNKAAADTPSAKKILMYYIGDGLPVQYPDQFENKVRNVTDTFAENRERVSIVLVINRTLKDNIHLFAPSLDEAFAEFISGCEAAESIQVYVQDSIVDKNLIDRCDAYYGDPGPYVPLFVNAHKPVMLQNWEI